MEFNIRETLENDERYKEGFAAYKEMETKAHQEAEKLAEALIQAIVRKEDKLNITTALMAVSKTLTHLASYLYDTEEEFLTDVQKARTTVVVDMIPALLDPSPCGLCEACKNGTPMECTQPKVRNDYTETRFIPLVCNMLVEYDLFNKILHMYAIRKENESSDAQNESVVSEPVANADPT